MGKMGQELFCYHLGEIGCHFGPLFASGFGGAVGGRRWAAAATPAQLGSDF